ncbi:hypothetical protein KEM56_006451 [Ascosphaera pollenicola]|nr:hypothetical protein KEM56_006451 [Ascosphaera pollenicola]
MASSRHRHYPHTHQQPSHQNGSTPTISSEIGLAISQGYYYPSVSSATPHQAHYSPPEPTGTMSSFMSTMSRRRRSLVSTSTNGANGLSEKPHTSSTAVPIRSRIFGGTRGRSDASSSTSSSITKTAESKRDSSDAGSRHSGRSESGTIDRYPSTTATRKEKGRGSGERKRHYAYGYNKDGRSSRESGLSATSPKKPKSSSGSSKHGAAKTTAKDVAELTDFQLGDCLGKGAFGSVYRALNWGSGQTVAVKQIRLADLPKTELRVIMHPNIVKYHGFVKSAETLNIILEYCENGSLHSISKNFGRFPENLVSLYMSQVLHGLLYLHEQGVIHRDIKGANILTTKEGLVKLADFGVASKVTGLHEASVVGTPYWMAPEVIELSGASTASDIWSLGCTVIELLDGKPPYADNHNPLQALFRIVNDDHPPLPQGASPAVTDFLMQCFQKDPNLRVSARKLLKHPWIINAKRSEPVDIRNNSTEYEEAVRSVQEWNEALKLPNAPTVKRPLRPGQSPSPMPQKEMARKTVLSPRQSSCSVAFRDPPEKLRAGSEDDEDNWDDDFVTAISPSSLHLPHLKPHDNFNGLLSSEKLKAFASLSNVNVNDAGPSGTVNANTNGIRHEESSATIKPTLRNPSAESSEAAMQTIRPYASTEGGDENTINDTKKTTKTRKFAIPSLVPSPPPILARSGSPSTKKVQQQPRPPAMFQEDGNEDYSDLIADSESIFERKLATAPFVAPRPNKVEFAEYVEEPEPIDGNISDNPPSPTTQLEQNPPKKLAIARRKSTRDISRFAEDETDEDFTDIIIDNENTFAKSGDDDKGSPGSTLQLSTKLSNNSWLGDQDDEDDPFAQLEEGLDQMDLEANIARDKFARLRNQVEELVGSLKTSQDEDVLVDISEQLVILFSELPETKTIIVSAHGILPILEILDTCRNRDVVSNLLKIVNAIIFDDYEVQENLCFVGGIPIINRYASKKYPREIRLEAAAFVQQMYQSSVLTLQMFVSAGGLNVLVEFVEDDYEEERDLVLIGVNGIWSVFDLQGSTPKNDFCRILSRNSVLDPLSLVLSKVLDEEGEIAEICEGRIAHIFLIFSQAESYVKEMVAERTVLHRVLKELKRMSPPHQITMLKFVKNLSMLSTTLESLQNSNAIDVLTELLRSTMKGPHFREVSNQVLNTIYNMCRLSKSRQEDAALNGIVPLLQKIVKTERPLKEFALPILCDMAHSGKVGRRELWKNKGLDFYISLLSDPYWQVTALDAIFTWLQEETAKVEEYLLDGVSIVPSFTDCIVRCLTVAKANSFENLLEPLQKLLRLSPAIAETLARPDMFSRVGQKLHHSKPGVRVNLLRIITTICESHEEGGTLLSKYNILESIRELQNDSRVLVRELATKLIISCEEADSLGGSARRRATGGFRRPSLTGSIPNGLPNAHQGPSPSQVARTPASKFLFDNLEPSRRYGSITSRRPGSGHDRSSSALSGATAVPPQPVKSRFRPLLGHQPESIREERSSMGCLRSSRSEGRARRRAGRDRQRAGRPLLRDDQGHRREELCRHHHLRSSVLRRR